MSDTKREPVEMAMEVLKKPTRYPLPGEEMVNHPEHYLGDRKFEPIDVINDWNLGFNTGTALKYISRLGRKDDEIQELEKAIFYLEDEIKRIKHGRSCISRETEVNS